MVVVAFNHVVVFFQPLVLFVNFCFANRVNSGNQLSYWPVVNGPAQLDLGSDLVTFRNGNVTHGVAETSNLNLEAHVVGNRNFLPVSDFFLNFGIVPPAVNNLFRNAKTGVDVVVFTVAMGTLVQVHVVKVNGVKWDVVQHLGCQV